jgi:hypothetical protein
MILLGTHEELLLDILLKRRILPLVLFTELFDAHHDNFQQNVVKPDRSSAKLPKLC